MKKNILLAIAIAVAGLMIAVSASAAIQIQPEEKPTFVFNKDPDMEIAGMEIAPLKGQVELITETEETVEPLAIPIVLGAHPAIASDALGYCVLGFDDESPNTWFTASDDKGQTWAPDAVGWLIDPPPSYPDVDSCGDGRFIGGMVPDYMASDGSELYKVEVSDPMDFTTPGYNCPFWSWWDVGDGYDNFDAIAAAGYTAADPEENTWAYGGHTIIGDHPVSGTDTPFYSYQFDNTGYAWIYRFTGLEGCKATAHDIDQTTLYSYGAWTYDNGGELDVYFAVWDFGQWVPEGSYVKHPSVRDGDVDSTGNDNYIDITASDDNIIIVSERDGDIVSYYSTNGGVNVMEAAAAIETGADNPRIVHMGPLTAICTFIKGGSVYYSLTEDGGATWGTPVLINEPENEYVPQAFKASDICGFGAAWENTMDTPGTIYFGPITIGSPPGLPTITGDDNGDAGTTYNYDFQADDPDVDDIRYIIQWGDGQTDTTGYVSSGTAETVGHKWSPGGTYVITARAQDTFGNIGPEATKTVTMPRGRPVNFPLFRQFLQNHPNIFPILRQLLGL